MGLRKTTLVALILFLLSLSSCGNDYPIGEEITQSSAEISDYVQPNLAEELTKTITKLASSQRVDQLSASRIQAYILLAAYLAYTSSERSINQAQANAVATARLVAADLYKEVPAVYNSFDPLLKKYNILGVDKKIIDLTTNKVRNLANNDKFGYLLSKNIVDNTSDSDLVPNLYKWEPSGLSALAFMESNYGSVLTISNVRGKCDVRPPSLNTVGNQVITLFTEFDPLNDSDGNIILFLAGVGTPTPAGQNLQIITTAVVAKYDEEKSLKIITASAIAMFDAGILTWHEKKKYMLARPETIFFRLTGKKINLLRDTPLQPSYPSEHSAFTGANAEVIDRLARTQAPLELTLADDSHGEGKTYYFEDSFTLLSEVNRSKVQSGFHTPIDVQTGAELGRCVGSYLVKNFDTIIESLKRE